MSRGERSNREMAGITETLRDALAASSSEDLAGRIERELAARGLNGGAEAERGEPERCGGCGGLKREADHERNSDRVCRCGGRKGRLLSRLDVFDPERRMTLDALDASEPTMAAAVEAMRGIVAGERRRGMLLMGLPGRGKCVGAGERLYLSNGTPVAAGDLVGREFTLLTLDKGLVVPAQARAEWNAVEAVLRLRTDSGREVVRNADHPFFAGVPGPRGLKDVRKVGWTRLGDVHEGSVVAAAGALPAWGDESMHDDEVKLLAVLLCEGGLTQPTPRVSQGPGPVLDETERIVGDMRARLVYHGGVDYRVVGTERRKVERPGTRSGYASVRVNRVADFLTSHGLAGCHSRDKRVPARVFSLARRQTALFLNRLYACDGWVYSSRGKGNRVGAVEVGFCTASRGLASDVQDLLLKFGLHADVRKKPKVRAWNVVLRSAPQVEAWCQEIGALGKEPAVIAAESIATSIRQSTAERGLRERGAWRAQGAPPGTRWEKVVSVQPAGVVPTVAIEVPGHHTFLSGFWEHNTHLMVGLGRELLARDRDAGYYNVVRLISRIQDSYSESSADGATRRAIVDSVVSHEVVLLDDLGKEHASTNVESIIYELVDALHVSGTTLVVATNVPATRGEGYRGPTLSERYDEAVRSRLRAMCERFVIKGEDRRRAAWEW